MEHLPINRERQFSIGLNTLETMSEKCRNMWGNIGNK